MVDGVVWLPLNSAGCRVHDTLGAVAGDLVTVTPHVSGPQVTPVTRPSDNSEREAL
jgi:NADH-quinone oxidoreductase subunit G